MASTVTELLRRRFGGKKGILPSGYTQLEYIQGAGKSLVFSTINNGDVFIVTAAESSPINTTRILLGYDITAGRWMGGTSNGMWGLGGGVSSNTSAADKTTMQVTFANTGVTLTIGGSTWSRATTFTISGTAIYIFGRGYDYLSRAKIYQLEQHRDGDIIKNFIPCQEVSTDKIGFYDIIGNNFIEY